MRKYEGLFIFPPEEASEARKAGEKRLEETIARLGGRILERREGGHRLLGYPVRKFREGRVLYWKFEMESHQVGELRKALEQDEKILKLIIVKPRESKPQEESAKEPRPAKDPARETVHGSQP